MAKHDPTFWQSVLATRDWARGKAEICLTWLPDWLEPYAVEVGSAVVLLGVLIAIWKFSVELWSAVIWAPRGIWRLLSGNQRPRSEVEIAADAAKGAEAAARQAAQTSEETLRLLLAGQANQAGAKLPANIVDRAVEAVREILSSNDPSKAKAQKALRAGDIQAAEQALEEAYNREVEAATRIGDEAQQLKTKAARTAREKAALAATRSVAEALRWYQNAAELEPDHFFTQIELARLHQANGNLGAALKAARAALQAATGNRERMVASGEIGNVLVAQGDLPGALQSHRAAMAIAKRLAKADPDNAGWLRDLSVSHNKIGDVLVAQGDLPGALQSHRAAMAIAKRLAEDDPDNAGWQRDYAVSLSRLAGFPDGGFRWSDVADAWGQIEARGFLAPTDQPALEDARRRADAEGE